MTHIAPELVEQQQWVQDYLTPTPEQRAELAEMEERNSRMYALQYASTLHNGLGTSADFILVEAEKFRRFIMNGAPKKTPVDIRPVKQED